MKANKKIILQIFTGGFNNMRDDSKKIIAAINNVLNITSVDKIILGWSVNRKMYEIVINHFSNSGMKFYLWLPVFSEIGLLGDAKLVEDINGIPIEGYSLNDDENFEFYCPSTEKNQRLVAEIYDNHFSNLGFKGVFLDKIRFPSFANGKSGGFGCFCVNCRKFYADVNLNNIERDISNDRFPMQLNNHKQFRFQDENWNKLYDGQENIIINGLQPIISYFRSIGLEIGMDTFSPYMARTVGQNLEKLSSYANFIKPMMYRNTLAPAGILFEYEAMLDELEIEAPSNWIIERPNISRELLMLSTLPTEVYAGIEVNRIAEIADIYPNNIAESMNMMIDYDIDGFVLSWNILSAPQENIDAALNIIKGQSI